MASSMTDTSMAENAPATDLTFDPGRNCWTIAQADRAAVIVDACDYFIHLRDAMMSARQRILLIGWDFDTRISLTRAQKKKKEPPTHLGAFILWLAENRPDLEIKILKWNFGSVKMLARGSAILTTARWALHDRITFKLDGAHPVGCSHHQKIVVIDDALAFCGGIDATADRWDTREHLAHDPRRKRPSGRLYGPWHDVTMAVDGQAAAALGKLGRDRWHRAGGEALPPCAPDHRIWPQGLRPDFEKVDLAISRTRADYQDNGEIREIEAMFVDQIAAAKRFIYAENQYFTSRRIAESIARRLAEPDPPEIFLVQPESADGWLEQQAMDGARVRLVRALREKDVHNRFSLMTAETFDGTPIYVHAKLLIVDDVVLRVGSANMNNRSLGLDSECDLSLMAQSPEDLVSQSIFKLRASLLAEHCGLNPALVEARLSRGMTMAELAAEPGREGARLVHLSLPTLGPMEEFIADKELLDPEKSSGVFEPSARRGLFRRAHLLRPPPRR